MRRLFLKLNLFISTYILVMILVFLKNMEEISVEEVRKVFCANIWFWSITTVILIISAVVLTRWIFYIRKPKNNVKKYRVGEIYENDTEILSYIMTFLIPIVSLDLNRSTTIIMNVILMLLVGGVFLRNNNFHLNPLLIILGYHVYKNSDEFIFISRRDKHDIVNKRLMARQIGTSKIFFID